MRRPGDRWAMVAVVLVGCGTRSAVMLPEVPEPCAAWPDAGMYRVDVPGFERSPWVLVPPDRGQRVGLVVLHGAAGNGQKIRAATSFRQHATQRGWVAAFPDGTGDADRFHGYTWNAGGCCGVAKKRDAPDLAFLEALGDTLRDRLCLERVMAAGHSNGGMMAMRWTCEGQGVDAVFSAAGPLVVPACGGAPTPVMHWQGTADPVVPLGGGAFELGEPFPVVRDAFLQVRRRNRCDDTPPNVASDGDLTCETWRCAAPTTFCAVDGWKHPWPGGETSRRTGPDAEPVAVGWMAERVLTTR